MPAKTPKTKVTTGHVGINVTDLARSKDFYVAALGLEVMTECDADGRRFAFLTDGQRVVISLWEQSRDRFDPALFPKRFEIQRLRLRSHICDLR